MDSGTKEIRKLLFDGTGNQLFQFAFGLRVAEELGRFVSLDLRGIPARGQQNGSDITELSIDYKHRCAG